MRELDGSGQYFVLEDGAEAEERWLEYGSADESRLWVEASTKGLWTSAPEVSEPRFTANVPSTPEL